MLFYYNEFQIHFKEIFISISDEFRVGTVYLLFIQYQFTDARGSNHIPSSVGDVRSHWVDTALFKQNRVVFDTSPSPDKAKLKIFNVSESDDGLYRCRVDFKTSQTRTSRLNLTVVGKCVQLLI